MNAQKHCRDLIRMWPVAFASNMGEPSPPIPPATNPPTPGDNMLLSTEKRRIKDFSIHQIRQNDSICLLLEYVKIFSMEQVQQHGDRIPAVVPAQYSVQYTTSRAKKGIDVACIILFEPTFRQFLEEYVNHPRVGGSLYWLSEMDSGKAGQFLFNLRLLAPAVTETKVTFYVNSKAKMFKEAKVSLANITHLVV